MTHDTNNYHKHGFSRLPGAEEDFNKWTVAQLREFLSVSPAVAFMVTFGMHTGYLFQGLNNGVANCRAGILKLFIAWIMLKYVGLSKDTH